MPAIVAAFSAPQPPPTPVTQALGPATTPTALPHKKLVTTNTAPAAVERTVPDEQPEEPLTGRPAERHFKKRALELFTQYGEASDSQRADIAKLILQAAHQKKTRTEDTDDASDGIAEARERHSVRTASDQQAFIDKLDAAVKELNVGQVGRALRKLQSGGTLPLNERTVQAIKTKYPSAPGYPHLFEPPPPPADLTTAQLTNAQLGLDPSATVEFTIADMLAFISRKSAYTGHGHDNWSYGTLKQLLHDRDKYGANGDAVLHGLHEFLLDIANGKLNTPTLRPLLTTLRGVAIDKGNGDPRPIGIGQLFTSIASALAVRAKDVTNRIPSGVGSTELMHGIPGGTEAAVHTVRALLAQNPSWVVCKTDIQNAFNALSREWVLAAAQTYPTLVPLANMIYGGTTSVVYGNASESVTIDAKMGVTQGDPLAAILYSTALRHAVDATLARHKKVVIAGIADDRYMLGELADVLDALATYKSELAKSGQSLQLAKTTVYKPGGVATIKSACDAARVNCADGIIVAGSPVGEDAFCNDYVRSQFAVVKSTLSNVLELFRFTEGSSEQGLRRGAKHAGSSGKVSRQDVYRIARSCISPAAVTFLMRTTPTRFTLPHVGGLEDAIFSWLTQVVDAKKPRADGSDSERYDVAKLITRLSARRGGLGLGDLTATATAAYVGSLALTGHIVKSFLTLDACSVKFDSNTNFAQLFPDVAAAFADGSLRRLDTYKDMQPGEFLNIAATRVQHRLCDFEARSAQARILEKIAEADDKAFFLSGGEEGAYWLMNPGSFKTRALTDVEFAILMKARLGLHVVADCDGPTPCPRCTTKQGTAPQIIGPSGTHVLTCAEGGKGGARGMRNIRHMLVKNAVRTAMLETARSSSAVHLDEPVVTDYFAAKDAMTKDDTRNRADISAVWKGRTVLLDIVVPHPTVRTNKAVSTTPGTAAADANTRKELQYHKFFDIPVGLLVPFAVETGGRWHPCARDFAKRWVKFGMASGENSEPDLTNPVIRADYAARIARFRATVSLATAVAVASALRYGVDHLSKGAVDPADGYSDSDEDVLAL